MPGKLGSPSRTSRNRISTPVFALESRTAGAARAASAEWERRVSGVVDFGRGIVTDPVVAGRLEWLVTNGIGGYASGTVAGMLSRRYHGLLIAALRPPVGRTLLVSKADETVHYQGLSVPLHADREGPEGVAPPGFQHIDRFRLEGTTPVWTFALSDALLEKRIWMEPGANTTYVRYELLRAYEPLTLALDLLVARRDHHRLSRDAERIPEAAPVSGGFRVDGGDGSFLYVRSDCMAARIDPARRARLFLLEEAEKGLDFEEDLLRVGSLRSTLFAGQTATLVLSTDEEAVPDGAAALERRSAHERSVLSMASPLLERAGEHEEEMEQLVLAADQFVVRRGAGEDPAGRSVIAGYPWFSDWGRDTMIALPGLALATGRHEIARAILRTFARHVDRGMLPNRFPDEGESPEYNTVDATLWYFEAIRATYEATGDEELLASLFPRLEEIESRHEEGTRFGIRMDPNDGLLSAGEPGVQLTWMDAKVGDLVVTPRIGKPVEVNALWYNALRSMGAFARALGKPCARFEEAADRARAGFDRFWRGDAGYCFDVLDGPEGDDASLRPNQLLAVSLPHSPLSPERRRAVVDACATRLLTPYGLRSLAPDHEAYVGRYAGNLLERDKAYHQGTVWGWLIGPFVSAHFRVYRDAALARSFLEPFFLHLSEHGLGTVSEIFDGDPPFTPRGCIAQAWSVAEILRVWDEITR
jgi:predicted glycogen debranching enzyme